MPDASHRDVFHQSCERLCKERGWSFSSDGVDVAFDGGRRQRVAFEFFEFEGRELVRLYSVIGDATRIDPSRLNSALRMNFTLPHGAMAVSDRRLVMVDTLMLEACGPAEIVAAIQYLAETADHFERTMFGPDTH